MIDRLLTTLQQAKLIPKEGDGISPLGMQGQLWDEDIADVLWLAAHITADATAVEEPEQETGAQDKTEDPARGMSGSIAPAAPPVPIHLPQPERSETSERSPQPDSGLPIQVKAAPALPDVRTISRALRPLMQKVPSRTKQVLDEAATIDRIAEQEVWLPVLKPERDRWLTLELVIEASPFGFIWEETLREFQEVLEYQGAFRNVRTWWLKADSRGQIRLGVKTRRPAAEPIPEPHPDLPLRHHPQELVDGSGRTLVLLVSDCRSPLWQPGQKSPGQIYPWLQAWSRYGPAAVVQLLPESLWRQTELDRGYGVQLGARQRGATHGQLLVRTHNREANRLHYSGQPVLPVPIVTLSAAALKQWALVVAGASQEQMPGRLFDLAGLGAQEQPAPLGEIHPMTPEERVELFEATASPTAQRLAKMMAAVPVSLPVVHLIQKHLLREAEAIHIAEVYSSGVLEVVPGAKGEAERYDFVPGVRALLNLRLFTDETFAVLDKLSENIAATLGLKGVRSFAALLSPRAKWTAEVKAQVLPFAQVATQVLYNLGGEYAAFAQKLVAEAAEHPDWPVQLEHQRETVEEDPWAGYPLQWFEFELGTLVRAEPSWPPEPYEFEVGWLEVVDESSQEPKPVKSGQKQQILEIRRPTQESAAEPEILIRREPRQGWQYRQPLGEGLTLDLVEIPAGTFWMGSPEDELEAYDDEKPQHEVTVASFLMGKYPVTQAQWRFVAGLPVVEVELDPDPSRFKGDARPVEQVSWLDTQEFCARLSVYTGRGYRLPSEAEWEYACRAGTTTPFHFGETIDAELANYQAQDEEFNGKIYPGKYGRGRFGDYRQQTTEPGSLNAANAWGLHDMHGNVWEWCQDHWHGNYENAPTDGSAWIDETPSEQASYVLRGGSWHYLPRNCRSACRLNGAAGTRSYFLGFRVVVEFART